MGDAGLHSSDWTQMLNLTGTQLPQLYQLPKDIWALDEFGTEKFIIDNKNFSMVNQNYHRSHSKIYWNWWENLVVTLSVTTCYT